MKNNNEKATKMTESLEQSLSNYTSKRYFILNFIFDFTVYFT